MNELKARRCHECGIGDVRPQAASGRVARYKNISKLPIPGDLLIPTCINCGAEWLDEEAARALDAALEVAYRAELQNRAQRAIEAITLHVSQRKLEHLLGLSQGYLSKLRARSRGPSAELVSQLALIAHNPKDRLRELEQYWNSPPLQEAAEG